MQKTLWVFCLAVLMFGITAIAPNAKAFGMTNAKSEITFNQPVEIPGHLVLPAGTYWFIAKTDFGSSPDRVLIYNADRTKLETELQTIPTERMKESGRERFTFAEQPNGQPMALVSWSGPGRMTGYRFVYSSRAESRLERENHVTLNVRPGQTAIVG